MGSFRPFLVENVLVSRGIQLFVSPRFCQAGVMQKLRGLKDEYRFPGFVPLSVVKGVFGDPRAVIISLRRCRKKHAAAAVARTAERITINVRERLVTCPAVISGCMSRLTCVGFNARSVLP